ncbi:MAG TPA: ankyrin repeat domain-containing protein [Polyangiaceae bacterium]|jgi:hypothetical protein|nr:ankyrin repeat domain-containing protein [Polyangiaceae bacterium]
MGLWQRFRQALFPSDPRPSVAARSSAKAPWLGSSDPGNPFGVPILDLMSNLQLISTTADPALAERALSWRPGQHDRLDWNIDGERIACDLEYRVEGPLPSGMLFLPQAMEDKWVMAWKDGRIAAARSWTGDTLLVAEAKRDAERLRVTQLTLAQGCGLSSFGDPVAGFHWMMESHALECRVPYPLSAAGAELLEATPLTAMSVFGHRLFCAATGYTVPASGRPLRSDGELVRALLARDLEQTRRLLDSGESVEAPSRRKGYRPLHLAALGKSHELVRLLLERGADPNQLSDTLGGALSVAAAHDADETILGLLLDAGADKEAQDVKGFRPLHAAAEGGNAAAVRFLVGRGVVLEPRTVNDVTPLHIACALGHLDAARELVRLGALPNAPSELGTPLEIARNEGKTSVAQWLESL